MDPVAEVTAVGVARARSCETMGSRLVAGVTRGHLGSDTSPERVLHLNLEDTASDVEEIAAGPADAPAPAALGAPGRRSPPLPSGALIRTTVAPGPRPIVLVAAEATHEPPARRDTR